MDDTVTVTIQSSLRWVVWWLGLDPLVQGVFKGLFDRNKTSFVSPFHVRRCSSHRRPVREDGSGSVSAQLVAKGNKTSFVSPFHVRRCSSHRRPVREDGSGSVSTQLPRSIITEY